MNNKRSLKFGSDVRGLLSSTEAFPLPPQLMPVICEGGGDGGGGWWCNELEDQFSPPSAEIRLPVPVPISLSFSTSARSSQPAATRAAAMATRPCQGPQ